MLPRLSLCSKFLIIFFGLVATSYSFEQPKSKNLSKKPNLLFILVDDQSPFDLKVYNDRSSLETPNIDALAKRGVVIDGAHQMGAWSGAVCTSSRHMIMSGRTLWHCPVRVRGKKAKPRPPENPNLSNPALVPPDLANNTMAAVFNRAGYDTMRTCKKGNSYDAANKLFTVVRDASRRGNTDETGSPWHAEQVLNYLAEREQANDTDPFLIYFGFSHPHDPRMGTEKLLKKYGSVNHNDKKNVPASNPDQPILPINYLPSHPFHHGHINLRDEVAVPGVWKNRDPNTIRNEIGRQFACSENIDIQIGRVIEKLESMGELENTIIFYTSDHGMAIGRHGLQGKQNLYEHTFRVPMIVAGPGVQKGKRALGNIYLADVLATLCDFASIEPPETNEGTSFGPVLRGEKSQIREVLYGAYSGGTKPGMRCVKQGDWKLIKYDVLDGKVRETQLFNLLDNPHEFLQQHQELTGKGLSIHSKPGQVNLADDPKHAKKRKELEALLKSEMERLDDPYQLWDQ